jgi:CheY-like chemotaxis protein
VAPVLGAVVALLGLLVLAGWAFDFASLKNLSPRWATMKANTALCFLLAGMALSLLGPAHAPAAYRLAGALAAAVSGAIGLLTVVAYVLGVELSLDEPLFSDPATPPAMHPGRPAPVAAALFVLVALVLLLLRAARPALIVLGDAVSGIVVAAAYLALIGYLYGAPGLYTVPGYSSMSAHTAVGFLLLGIGLFLARADRCIMRLVTTPRAAGATARRLLPVALLAPVLLGYAELYALEDDRLGRAAADLIVIVSFVAVFTGTVLWSAVAVDRVDAARQQLEIAGHVAKQQAKTDLRLRSLLESAPDANVLGLSMVHGFVRQSGGALEMISAPGNGTTVRLLLPAAGEAAEVDVALVRPRLIGPRNVTVLVVEDEPEVLRTAALTLRGLGYTVIEAADGPSALAALQQAGHVDVLFTDVVLPKGMSGRDLAEVAHAHQPHIEVIYTSGYNDNVIVHDNMLDKGVTLVRKPYSREDLLAAITAATRTKTPSLGGRWGSA